MANQWGIHLANGEQDVGRVISLGCDHYLALEMQAHYLAQCPGNRYVRLWNSPKDDLSDMVAKARRYDGITDHIIPWNEANIETDLSYRAIAEAFLKFRQMVGPDVVLHWPALSPSRGYREHAEEWLPAARAADVVDVHAYGTCEQMLEIVDWHHQVLPDKELLVSEFNAGAGNTFDQAWWAGEALRFLEALQERPWVRAAVGFIWEWHHPDVALPSTVNWKDQPIETAVRNAAKPERRIWLEGGNVTRKASAPVGVGFWVWYLEKALHGRTPEQFAEVCRSNGITHLFVKTSDGAFAGGDWAKNAAGIAPLRAAGLKVYSWSYNYGDNPRGEAEVVNDTLRLGVDGHVFDIEAECEGKKDAIEFMWQIVRTAFPNAWLAYAPLPVVDFHDPPLYGVSNKYADAVMPQFYWTALGTTYGELEGLFARWERWAKTWSNMPELLPVGQAYDKATPEEIAKFAQMCQARGIPECSFWEWAGSTDAQWGAVATAAKAWGQVPIPTPGIDLPARVRELEEQLAAALADAKRHQDLAETRRILLEQIKGLAATA